MYTYILPDDDNNPVQYNTETNVLILIGANGSGKSRLGAWIEKNSLEKTHRIGAQRSLTFGNYIQQKGYEQSANWLLYGNELPKTEHDQRWKWDGEQYNYETSMLEDYEYVLSALVALKVKQEEAYIEECKKLEKEDKSHNPVPENVVDVLKRIWSSVFPHRDIDVTDGKVIAKNTKNGEIFEYNGKEMSDGERVALYLIAQTLCVPKEKTIVIDEPEIHLHRSIMNRLWTAIEKERQDCLFVYITHDTQFAANHNQAKKIWVKDYDGKNWKWEEIRNSILPEQMLLDILGNRKPVLFVEGTADSYDTKLYAEVFKGYYIVPCGSCSSVIAWTKAMKNTTQLHDLHCYGIIDRDYRTDYEMESYKSDNIYTLKVAEVENLFLIPEILEIVNSIMGFSDMEKVENVKNYIVEKRFAKELNKQICESVVAELKYKLSTATISNASEEAAKQTLDNVYKQISYEDIKSQHEQKFNEVYASKDYKEVLRVFNRKSLSTSTGHFFDLDNRGYCNFVIRQLATERADSIINAIALYVPEEIPKI